MKVARSNNIDSKTVAYGGAAGKWMVKFMGRFVPKLKHTTTKQEGLKLLYKELEAEIFQASGVKSGELGYKVLEELRNNMTVEYKKGRVCITYRKFKKCMKIDKK